MGQAYQTEETKQPSDGAEPLEVLTDATAGLRGKTYEEGVAALSPLLLTASSVSGGRNWSAVSEGPKSVVKALHRANPDLWVVSAESGRPQWRKTEAFKERSRGVRISDDDKAIGKAHAVLSPPGAAKPALDPVRHYYNAASAAERHYFEKGTSPEAEEEASTSEAEDVRVAQTRAEKRERRKATAEGVSDETLAAESKAPKVGGRMLTVELMLLEQRRLRAEESLIAVLPTKEDGTPLITSKDHKIDRALKRLKRVKKKLERAESKSDVEIKKRLPDLKNDVERIETKVQALVNASGSH